MCGHTKETGIITGIPDKQGEGQAKTMSRIIEFSSEMYRAAAEKLAKEIESKDYYAGNIELEFEELRCLLTSTLIIYGKTITLSGGETKRAIEDIVPVWWEMHTIPRTGVEIMNDFSFARLKDVLLEKWNGRTKRNHCAFFSGLL